MPIWHSESQRSANEDALTLRREINASFTAARARATHSTGSIVKVPRCKCSQCSISNWFWMRHGESIIYSDGSASKFLNWHTHFNEWKERERGGGKKQLDFPFRQNRRFVVRSFCYPRASCTREKSWHDRSLQGQIHDRCVTIKLRFYLSTYTVSRYINYPLNR